MVVTRRFGLGTLIAILLLSAAFFAPGGATAQSVTIDPGAAAAGSTVTASGSGWAVGILVRVEWEDGTLLGDVVLDAEGTFTFELVVPDTATPGDYVVRFIGYVPPYVEDCTVDVVEVTFTVLPAGVTATPGTATATVTATEAGSTTPTVVATQCATATGETETPTGTTETPTGTTTAVVTETTTPATATFTATSAATGTATATFAPTATATRTATATPTKTPTATPTKTPTKIVYPGTGSAGLLDQGDDDNDGGSTPLIIAVVVLGAGITAGTAVAMRRRMA